MTDIAGESLRGLSVLYVEDDEEIREQLARILRRRVGALYLAGNGQEGLEAYRRHRPDLIITDILMPLMDGLTMAAEIRRESRTTPIIVTTAFERPDYLIRSIELGIDKYVIKPVRKDLLLEALDKCAAGLRAAALLRESEERHRLMFQSFQVGVCVVRPDLGDPRNPLLGGRIQDCNEAFLGLSGYPSLEALRGLRYADLIPEDARPWLAGEGARRLLEDGRIAESERDFLRADGTRVSPLTQSLLRRDIGAHPGELWEMVTDISEQKRTREQLQLAARVFESSGEGILITDSDNRIVSVNRAFTRITGYSADEVRGRTPSLLASGLESPALYENMWDALNETGYWQGEIRNRRKDGQVFPEWLSITAIAGADGRASQYIGMFSDITERKRAEEHIRYLAQHDALTGLPNRVLLRDRLERAFAGARRERKRVGLLFLDLDNFKTVNDSMGHQYGDLLLKEVAARLQRQLRASDTISRQGGDEFLVVLDPIVEPNDAALAAGKLLAALAEPITIGADELHIGSSIGICVYPNDGDDVETLIRNADAAMYCAKRSGRNTYRFFTRDMNDEARERLTLEKRLRRAIQEQKLEVYFQPQIDLASGRLIGAEALLRWNDPEHGAIPPSRFVPLAEETGLIVPLGAWVLEESCRHAAAWAKSGLAPIRLAINLSSIQLRQEDFVARLRAVIAATGVAPEALEIEITETALMDDTLACVAATRELGEMGVALALDDFGTGFSNLSYLQRLAVHKLKIDSSFVRDLITDENSRSIVHAIVGLAKNLGMLVIAEGVEEARQAEFLAGIGCDQAQGYLFGRPMPAADFTALLAREKILP